MVEGINYGERMVVKSDVDGYDSHCEVFYSYFRVVRVKL